MKYRETEAPPCKTCKHKNKLTVEAPCYSCISNEELALHKPNSEIKFVNYESEDTE